MAVVLSIETATSVCSVAIHRDEMLIVSQELFIDRSHSAHLNDCIGQLTKMAGLEFGDYNAIAVSKGPGSYTGLRIGTSTAKGLCYALDIPLIAINTLEAMAHETNRFNIRKALLCPMIDARRMEVYCTIIDHSGRILQPTQALVVEPDSFDRWLDDHELWLFGSGAAKTRDVLKSHPGLFHIDGVVSVASSVGQLAMERYKKDQFEDIAYFEPFYLKDFIAKKPKIVKP